MSRLSHLSHQSGFQRRNSFGDISDHTSLDTGQSKENTNALLVNGLSLISPESIVKSWLGQLTTRSYGFWRKVSLVTRASRLKRMRQVHSPMKILMTPLRPWPKELQNTRRREFIFFFSELLAFVEKCKTFQDILMFWGPAGRWADVEKGVNWTAGNNSCLSGGWTPRGRWERPGNLTLEERKLSFISLDEK